MKNAICIYHGNCPDGFGSAYALWKFKGGNFDFYPGVYQEDPPWDLIKDKHVYLLDFSYKKPIILKMLEIVKTISIIDHHKSAIEELDSIPELNKHFDINHSGCILTWKYLFNTEPPELLKYIEDRDLWKFKLPYSREVSMELMSHDYDFEIWDTLIKKTKIESIIQNGRSILRKFNKDLNEILKLNARRTNILGYDVPIANMPYIYASEGAGKLSENEKFAACYFYKPNSIYVSLRSNVDYGIDVSEIAKSFGGGGHKNAAAFELKLENDNLDILNSSITLLDLKR